METYKVGYKKHLLRTYADVVNNMVVGENVEDSLNSNVEEIPADVLTPVKSDAVQVTGYSLIHILNVYSSQHVIVDN